MLSDKERDRKLSVLILDSNKVLSETLSESFSKNGRLFVTCAVREGNNAVQLLDIHKPDVLLMDIVLPLKDGLSVLEDIKKSDVMKNKSIIVSTSMFNDLAMRRVVELGADYFLLKPFDIDILIKRIIEIHEEKRATEVCYTRDDGSCRRNVNSLIREFLFRCGIENNIKGYSYLQKAVFIGFYNKETLYSLTKHVYPTIAKEVGCDETSVERAIRYAIQTAWKRGAIQRYFKEMGYDNIGVKRPTNGSFLKIANRAISGEKGF